MAFDFVSYITQQLEQHSNFLVEEPKAKKQAYLLHLVSFQLHALVKLSQQSTKQAYDLIKEKHHAWLVQKTADHLVKDPLAQDYFSPIQNKLTPLNEQIATVLVDELYQLNENAHLGSAGIHELLVGQYPWLQDQVQSWFWDSVEEPEYKLTEPKKDEKAEFHQVMKEFSQMIHEQAQAAKHEPVIVDTPPEISVENLYRFINPVIALAIIYILFSSII